MADGGEDLSEASDCRPEQLQHCPVDSKKLRLLAASGELRPETHVWKEGMVEWKRADEIRGLVFPPAPQQPVPPPVVIPPVVQHPPGAPTNKPPDKGSSANAATGDVGQMLEKGGQLAADAMDWLREKHARMVASANMHDVPPDFDNAAGDTDAAYVPDWAPPPSRSKPPVEDASGIQEINSVIPSEQRHLLMKGERAYHFEWMDSQGGCGSTESSKQFILVTDQRVLYEATILEGEGVSQEYVRTSGSIPLAKVSFVGTSSAAAGCFSARKGCNHQETHLLKVGSGGGNIVFSFFSEKKAKRVQHIIETLITSP